jgi:toxin ParE1/3/4
LAHSIVYSERAEAQLGDLYAYIADQSGERRAVAFVGTLTAYCAGFATFPERGTRRPDIRPGLRIIGFRGRVTVAFEVLDGSVVILGIFYGGQDFENDPKLNV